MIYPIWFQTPLYSFSVGKLGGKLMFWVVAHRAKVSVWGWVSNSLQPERAGKIPGAGKDYSDPIVQPRAHVENVHHQNLKQIVKFQAEALESARPGYESGSGPISWET